MTDKTGPDTLAALALVPEQLPAYVRAVAGSKLHFCEGFAVYVNNGEAVLVGYPLANTVDLAMHASEQPDPALERVIAGVSGWPGLTRLHVLAPQRPKEVPHHLPGYTESADRYLCIDLPCLNTGDNFSGVASQKLRNMLRRAARELAVSVESWNDECRALVDSFLASRVLESGTRHIFGQLASYAALSVVTLFAARNRKDASLHGFCLCDCTPLTTAFYMFAFRRDDAVPGTADLLLHALLKEAQRNGYERVNLGLAINGGIGFFKTKWGAREFLPLLECSWPLAAPEPERSKTLCNAWDRAKKSFWG